MKQRGAAVDPEVWAELDRLILRCVRVGLAFGLATVIGHFTVNHFWWAHPPQWSDVFNLVMFVLIGIAFALTKLSIVARHPAAFALLTFSIGCAARALAGIWHDGVVVTALMLLSMPLITAGMIPWGLLPQVGMTLVAGTAITANALLVEQGFAAPPGQAATTIALGLLASVVLAVEVQRHRVQTLVEVVRRRQAEERLARLNAELERRVVLRTEELERTAARLAAEARERQLASQELRDSQRRLQDIVGHAAAHIQLKDTEGRYLLVNRHWEETFGRDRAEVIGRTVHDLFPREIADAFYAGDQEVLTRRQNLQFENTLSVRGVPTTYVTVKFPILDAEGNAVGVCGISTDITDRKAMEADLQRSRASLTALVDNTTDAIWSVDRDLNVTAMNAVARARFCQRYSGELGPAARARVEPALADEFHAYYRRALAGEHVQIERSYDQPDGTRHYLTSVHPIIENGTITGATVFSKDVTERRRAEELARAHQAELAHVLRVSTVGEMAAGLAHEINQPLGAVANYAQGSVRRLRDGSIGAVELLPIIEAIAHEALRAGEIIRRLRELLRKEPPTQQPVDLNRLVRESAQFVAGEARERDIAVQLDFDPHLPPVRCNSVQIEQVVLNLLLNAVDAVQAAANGDRRVSVSTHAAGADTVEVAVRDSGPGLPDADVFAPFYTTKSGGLGMGLSISRSIVEAHGGHLGGASNSDVGSTFRFTLPIARPREEDGVRDGVSHEQELECSR